MTGLRHRYILSQIAGIALATCVLAIASNSRAQEELADGADFNALLRAKLKVVQEGFGTAPGARQLAENFRKSPGLSIFLDRRVDPDAEMPLELPELRVEFALREVALRQKMGMVVRDGYVYIGPPRFCRWWSGALENLAQHVSKLPANTKQFWQAESQLEWDEGATPRELAMKVSGAKLSAVQSDLIPHDIWAAFDGPRIARWEQLALVCGGFDLVPEFAANGEVSLRPLVEGKIQQASVLVPSIAMSEVTENIQRYFPEVKASAKQGKLGIEGSSGEVKAIQSWFVAPPPSKKPPANKPKGPVSLLTTPVPVPVRQLLLKLAQDYKCELVVSPDVSPEAMNKAIKPNWTGTREELLAKISEEIGLLCELREGKILVFNR